MPEESLEQHGINKKSTLTIIIDLTKEKVRPKRPAQFSFSVQINDWTLPDTCYALGGGFACCAKNNIPVGICTGDCSGDCQKNPYNSDTCIGWSNNDGNLVCTYPNPF
jgi:hypothetical protein